MIRLLFIPLLALLLLLTGCATPYGGGAIGVGEEDLRKGNVQIRVLANYWTPAEKMEALWQQHAASVARSRKNGSYETLQFEIGRETLSGETFKVASGIIQLK